MDERIKQNYKNYYDIIDVIGNGGFGIIYKGKIKNTNDLRAIKVMNFDKIKECLLIKYNANEIEQQLQLCIQGFINEFENMKICSMNNENSVKCYEYFYNKEHFVIIMELCDNNLGKLLTERYLINNCGFNEKEIYEILKQLNKTFNIMKNNKIIHRDLKLENILIKYSDQEHKKYTIKLTDYGCSKRLSSLTNNYLNTFSGTMIYMAPEILKKKRI